MNKRKREIRNALLLFPNKDQEKRLDSDHYVEGYATTFEPYVIYEDDDGRQFYEKIDSNAFVGADLSDVIMQYDHAGRVFARTSNKTLLLDIDSEGFFIAADLSTSTGSREFYEDIDGGLITKMSWAFTVAEDSYDRETRTRTIKRIKKVYDVSAVSIPANNDTSINARSYFDGVIEAERQELLEQKKRRLQLKIKLMEE